MKFIASVLLIAVLSVAACLYLPWWVIAIVGFLVAIIIPQRPGMAFLSGFISLFILWGLIAWFISSNNDHILAHKISLLILKKDSPLLLVVFTALIGALVTGFASLTGSLARR